MPAEAIDYAALSPGTPLTPSTFVLESEAVAAYVQAVEDAAIVALAPLVPPTAIAAQAMRALMEELRLPAGSVHVSQELEFHRPVAVGEAITCQATIARNAVRGDWRFMTIEMAVSTNGETAMTGRASVMLPAGG